MPQPSAKKNPIISDPKKRLERFKKFDIPVAYERYYLAVPKTRVRKIDVKTFEQTCILLMTTDYSEHQIANMANLGVNSVHIIRKKFGLRTQEEVRKISKLSSRLSRSETIREEKRKKLLSIIDSLLEQGKTISKIYRETRANPDLIKQRADRFLERDRNDLSIDWEKAKEVLEKNETVSPKMKKQLMKRIDSELKKRKK